MTPRRAAMADRPPNYLGPILLMLLGLALIIAIGLALQFGNHRTSAEPLPCDGLYASVDEECCDADWVENWAPCRLDCTEADRDAPAGEGLFDAEARFADPTC